MATKKKTETAEKTVAPAKKTATKKTTTAAKEVTLSFRGEESEPVKMPNGQTVRKTELPMLVGMLRLEVEFGKENGIGESAQSIAQALLKSKKKGVNLIEQLSEFEA